jgi:hypothetical protein
MTDRSGTPGCARSRRTPSPSSTAAATPHRPQEESLARASALHTCLLTVPEFYADHRAEKDLLYSDRIIYSPGVPAALRCRAARVLEVAASHGHRRLVLGAWGCGVFGNDPVVVADAFADALSRYDGFEHVCFAVLDRQQGTPVYDVFARVFAR